MQYFIQAPPPGESVTIVPTCYLNLRPPNKLLNLSNGPLTYGRSTDEDLAKQNQTESFAKSSSSANSLMIAIERLDSVQLQYF